jgi:hypothetical protein
VSFGDINSDGRMEVVFGTTLGLLYALRGSDGSVLPHFPIVTGGSVVAPVLLVNVGGLLVNKGLHLVVPSHDGHVYIVDGMSACVESIDIDEKASAMVLADDVTGNGKMDLVVTTIQGGVYVFETQALFDPLNSWPSKTKGVNVATAGLHHVGISITPSYRQPRDVRGDRFQLQFVIEDSRQNVTAQQYTVNVYIGSRIRVFHRVFRTAGIQTITVHTPLERMYASVTVVMGLPNGQLFTDSVAVSFNMHFLETVKITFLFVFCFVSGALLFVRKTHEVLVVANEFSLA